MPVYKVTTTIEAVIFARSEDDAVEQSTGVLIEEAHNGLFDVSIAAVESLRDLPEGWSAGSLVYGRYDEVTVAEALAKEAAIDAAVAKAHPEIEDL